MLLANALTNEIIPLYQQVYQRLQVLAGQWQAIPMLARTHGQPASPTRLGKELMVFCERIEKQLQLLSGYSKRGQIWGSNG